MKHYHFIGIGGIGMSGLAQILLERGDRVSGSDISSNDLVNILKEKGAHITREHSPDNIPDHAIVVYSSGIHIQNSELLEAKRRGNPILHRSELLHSFMQAGEAYAVAGTHGKTTTTALLSSCLMEAGLDPTFVNGGIIKQYKTNSRSGKGRCVVVEADESDGTFTKYFPKGAIITNIDSDHMDHYQSENRLMESFDTFLNQVASKEHLFFCKDDLRLKKLNPCGVSYGLSPDCALLGRNLQQQGWVSMFDLTFEGKEYRDIHLSLIGKHNILNALGVFGLSLRLGINESQIRKAFREFQGVQRRCDHLGTVGDILILDDYAHHPTEIQTTLQGMRDAIGDRRFIVIFQPHRYSRTEQCLHEFSHVFGNADVVIVTDIYSAGEAPIPGITAERLERELSKQHPASLYIPRDQLIEAIASMAKPYDVIATIGAGDIVKIGKELIKLRS